MWTVCSPYFIFYFELFIIRFFLLLFFGIPFFAWCNLYANYIEAIKTFSGIKMGLRIVRLSILRIENSNIPLFQWYRAQPYAPMNDSGLGGVCQFIFAKGFVRVVVVMVVIIPFLFFSLLQAYPSFRWLRTKSREQCFIVRILIVLNLYSNPFSFEGERFLLTNGRCAEQGRIEKGNRNGEREGGVVWC